MEKNTLIPISIIFKLDPDNFIVLNLMEESF